MLDDDTPDSDMRQTPASATMFVAGELVTGTLRQGFGMYQALDEPFARALFIMFLVAKVSAAVALR